MTPWLRVVTALAEDSNSVPSTHIRQAVHNHLELQPRKNSTPLAPYGTRTWHLHTPTHRNKTKNKTDGGGVSKRAQ